MSLRYSEGSGFHLHTLNLSFSMCVSESVYIEDQSLESLT